MAMHPQHPQRPDSPTDNNHLISNHIQHHQLSYKSSFHNSEQLFNLHSGQTSNQNMYNNGTIHNSVDYTSDHDGQKPLTKMTNGYTTSLRTPASFNNFPIRQRHAQPALNQYREQPTNFSNSYPTAADVFAPATLSHLTSPTQSQHAAIPFESLHQGRGFDYPGSQATSGFGGHSKQSYIVDSFGASNTHQAHSAGAGKSSHSLQTHQSSLSLYSANQPYNNGPQIHSQTPYGPHLQTAGPNSATTVPAVGHINGASLNPAQEEISTIFVVGFPDDMQEREFQNMFTFSEGFEAATLKIPNKEYTAYGGTGTAAGAAGSMRQGYNQSFTGSNDPYNLVTINQGGVVVDGGRDSMSSWQSSVPGISQEDHFIPGTGGSVQSMPPRKQIIGFAKFRTRQNALEARDILQGKRVDVEKGAVLKAEMAKKNLHTKRGVGPLQLPTVINGAANGIALAGTNEALSMTGLASALPSTSFSDRDFGSMGFWKEQRNDGSMIRVEEDERERRRDREAGIINAMGLGAAATRGPRERAEEDERERERRRKEKEAKLRSTAFEAFHSVPPQIISRHASSTLLSPTSEGVLTNGLHSASVATAYPLPREDDLEVSPAEAGPWDNGARKLSVPLSGPSGASLRSSSTHRSASPNPQASYEISPGDTTLTQPPRSLSPRRDFDRQFAPASRQISSKSSLSSIGGDSHSSVLTDSESSRGGLAVSTNHGSTSPQLPSPASGASSTSTRNLVDQNPPINTLYVGNLPTSQPPPGFSTNYLEEHLRELFQGRPGFRKLCFRQKNNGPMCFVEFEDVSFATRALNDLYGNTLNGLIKGGGIRLSYSKNPLGVRTPVSAGGGPSFQQQQLQNNTQSFASESLQPRQAETFQPTRDVPTRQSTVELDFNRGGSQRRDATGSMSYMMTSPPPPRFFSPPNSAVGSFSSNIPPQPSFPRFSAFGGFNTTPTASSFSPFGGVSASHPEMNPEHGGANTHDLHFTHRDLPSSASNLEAARAS